LALGIGKLVMRQDLDRYCPMQACILRAVDFAHASGAEWSKDFVGTKPIAYREGHDQGVYRKCAVSFPVEALCRGHCSCSSPAHSLYARRSMILFGSIPD